MKIIYRGTADRYASYALDNFPLLISFCRRRSSITNTNFNISNQYKTKPFGQHSIEARISSVDLFS